MTNALILSQWFIAQLAAAAVPPQSRRANVMHPGIGLAAIELGVHRGHLHRVLTGERKSKTLLTRWHGWLLRNPQYSKPTTTNQAK
jgi:hypothetical protein